LAPITLPNGEKTDTVLLPFTMHGHQLSVRLNPPKLGEHTLEILTGLGYTEQQAKSLSNH
jgi:crotonobetainyl-CoA:carnitine CoA-transferase CaiB-like acyl-CoA transferase